MGELHRQQLKRPAEPAVKFTPGAARRSSRSARARPRCAGRGCRAMPSGRMPYVSSYSRWPTTCQFPRRSPCRARWRCRGRCSPRSCGASIGCAARPCGRRDAAERGGRGIRGGSAPKGDERHRSSPIRPWSRIWWFSPTGIRLSTAPTALGRLRSAPDGRRLEHGHTAFGKCRLRTGASRVGPPHSVGSSGREKGGPRGR
jgi:hypothetical protein